MSPIDDDKEFLHNVIRACTNNPLSLEDDAPEDDGNDTGDGDDEQMEIAQE
jgi:hypothetical protein